MYLQDCLDNIGGGAGDSGDYSMGYSFCSEASVYVDYVQTRMAISNTLLQIPLIGRSFCCFSKGTPNLFARHPVNLKKNISVDMLDQPVLATDF